CLKLIYRIVKPMLSQQPRSKSIHSYLPYYVAVLLGIIWSPFLSAQGTYDYRTAIGALHRPAGLSSMVSTNYPGSLRQIGGSRWVTPMMTIKTNVTELATTTLN